MWRAASWDTGRRSEQQSIGVAASWLSVSALPGKRLGGERGNWPQLTGRGPIKLSLSRDSERGTNLLQEDLISLAAAR